MSLISSWYERSTLINDTHIEVLVRNFINLWPWANTDSSLELKYMTALVFISEDSLPVCKAIATVPYGCPKSLFKLIVELVQKTSNKVKVAKYSTDLLRTSLRVLSNCCSSVEGRSQIGKV